MHVLSRPHPGSPAAGDRVTARSSPQGAASLPCPECRRLLPFELVRRAWPPTPWRVAGKRDAPAARCEIANWRPGAFPSGRRPTPDPESTPASTDLKRRLRGAARSLKRSPSRRADPCSERRVRLSILDRARVPPSIQFQRSSSHARRQAPRPAANGAAELWDRAEPTVATDRLPLSYSPRNTGSLPADRRGAPSAGPFLAPFQRLLPRKQIADGCETKSRGLRMHSRWDRFAVSLRAVEDRCKRP